METTEAYPRRRLIDSWREAAKNHLDTKEGIPAVLKHFPALQDWEKVRSLPSGRAEDQLRYGVLIATTNYDHELVPVCLGRAIEVADAGAQDSRWDTWWSETRHIERGKLSSVGVLAKAWLHDDEIDAHAVTSAAHEILKGSVEERPSWTEMAQAEYLYGVQLLLCGGQLEQAHRALSPPKDFARMYHYYGWLKRAIELLTEPSVREAPLRKHYDSYYDHLRDPFFAAPANGSDQDNLPGLALIRLRLALIRWIYIERQPVAGNWRHIIGQIGY